MIFLERQGIESPKYELCPEKSTVLIGRLPTNDVQFSSHFVSRKHCEIQRIPPHGTLIIKHCTDTNSTHVDNVNLTKEGAVAELRVGSIIGLGVPLDLIKNEDYLTDPMFVFLKLCEEGKLDSGPEPNPKPVENDSTKCPTKSGNLNEDSPLSSNESDVSIEIIDLSNAIDKLPMKDITVKKESILFPDINDDLFLTSSENQKCSSDIGSGERSYLNGDLDQKGSCKANDFGNSSRDNDQRSSSGSNHRLSRSRASSHNSSSQAKPKSKKNSESSAEENGTKSSEDGRLSSIVKSENISQEEEACGSSLLNLNPNTSIKSSPMFMRNNMDLSSPCSLPGKEFKINCGENVESELEKHVLFQPLTSISFCEPLPIIKKENRGEVSNGSPLPHSVQERDLFPIFKIEKEKPTQEKNIDYNFIVLSDSDSSDNTSNNKTCSELNNNKNKRNLVSDSPCPKRHKKNWNELQDTAGLSFNSATLDGSPPVVNGENHQTSYHEYEEAAYNSDHSKSEPKTDCKAKIKMSEAVPNFPEVDIKIQSCKVRLTRLPDSSLVEHQIRSPEKKKDIDNGFSDTSDDIISERKSKIRKKKKRKNLLCFSSSDSDNEGYNMGVRESNRFRLHQQFKDNLSSNSANNESHPVQPKYIKKEKDLDTSSSDSFSFNKPKVDIEFKLPSVRIKSEPGIEPSSKFDDDSDDDGMIVYSQMNDIILISSDEEPLDQEPTGNSSLENVSFGPLPPHEANFETSSIKPLKADYNEPDCNEPDLPDLIGMEGESMYSNHLPDSRDDLENLSCHLNAEVKKFAMPVEEDEEDQDDWWPQLSQNFLDEEKEGEKNESEKKNDLKIANCSPMKDLENLINKINNRKVSKSRLTEPQAPVPKTRGRKRKNRIEVPPPTSSSIPTPKPSTSSIPTPKPTTKVIDKKQQCTAEEKNTTNQKVPQQFKPVQGVKLKKSSKGIRNELVKAHKLNTFQGLSKERHHINGKPKSRNVCNEASEIKSTENISIKPKSKESASVKKGIAKISKVSRNQKLTEVDLFGPTEEPKPKVAFKIPKKMAKTTTDVNKEENIQLERRVLSFATASIPSNPVCKRVTTPVTEAVPVDEMRGMSLKGILKTCAKSPTRLRYRVRFPPDDQLVAIKFIPIEKRLCVGPESVQLKEMFIKRPAGSNNVIDHPFEFIHKVCSWNYDWLATYKISKERNFKASPPRVCENTILPTLTYYQSFNDYKNTFSTLMYYEAWESVFRDWNLHIMTNASFNCEVDTCTSRVISTLKFCSMKAFCLIPNEWSIHGKHPTTGSLIIMKHKMGSNAGYSFSFGYIENVTKRRTQFIPQHLKSISQPGANTVVVFEILFSKSYIENVTPGALVSISNISYIRPSLRAFESLCRLPSSSLSPYILNPGDLSVYRNESKKGQYLVHQLSLNEVQKEAVINVSDKCVNGLDVPKISLIHGPPGTGKTRVIAALVTQINQLFKETPGLASNRRILLCAPSNAVVDEMIIRLAKLKDVGIHINVVRFGVKQSMQPEVNEFSFDTKVRREFSKKQIPNNKSIELEIQKKRNYSEQATLDFNKAVKENQPENEINKKKHRMFELLRSQENFEKSCKIQFTPSEKVKVYESCKKLVLMRAEVVATTLTSCLTGSLYEVFGDSKVIPFSCCIVDEAGQCKETETWFPLQLGIKKLILVGDHLQLPATVLSQLSQGKKLHQSLFQRIYHHIGVEKSQMDVIHSLNVQYRMHEEILAWPSMQFYDNTLTTASGVLENRRYALKPYIVFDVTEKSCEDRGKKGEIYNLTEVHLIRSLIEAHEKYLSRLSIGILTPYQQQKSLLLEKLDRLIKKHKITVSTVDNFQGKEKDIIYCSFVRSNAKGNIGFVSDRQRLNVALTRARKSCFIVGDVSSLQSNGGDWRSLVENARRRSLVRSVNKEMIENKKLLLEMSLI